MYVTMNSKRIGFPITTNNPNFREELLLSNEVLYKLVLENLVDMDNQEQLKSIGDHLKPEVIINYNNNPYGEIEINLRFNLCLSKNRKQIENKNSLYKNILFIFIDSLSRPQFLRKLPKTSNFLLKFMKYKGYSLEKNKTHNFHGFEFLKYHALGNATFGNEIPMIYGKRFNEENMFNINKYFQENGYVTGSVNGLCGKDSSIITYSKKNDEVIPKYGNNYDYEFFSLSCDPFHGIGWNTERGMNSYYKRCLYGKMLIEHQIEYANQFFIKYKNNQKFFRFIIQDAHDPGTNSLISFDDDFLVEFLNNLYKNNLLNEGALFVLSDHGNLVAPLLYIFEEYKIEGKLPFLFIVLSDKNNLSFIEQYKHIKNNQQIFIHAYDIYNTLSNIVFGNEYQQLKNKTELNDYPKTKKGKSLFEYINPKTRECRNFPDFECECV